MPQSLPGGYFNNNITTPGYHNGIWRQRGIPYCVKVIHLTLLAFWDYPQFTKGELQEQPELRVGALWPIGEGYEVWQ